MALDDVLKCRRTIAKRRSGPLAAYLDGFCQWLQERGYEITTVGSHLSRISRMESYFRDEDLDFGCDNPLSFDAIHAFIEAYPAQRHNHGPLEPHLKLLRCSLNYFIEYLDEASLIHVPEKHEIYDPLLTSYLDWMRVHRYATPGTLEVRRNYIVQFFKWLGPEATIEALSNLTAEGIERFFLSYGKSSGSAARRSMRSTLRTFLQHCFHKGYTQNNLDNAVPLLRTYKLSTVPRGFKENETQEILECSDRSTHAGRRNFAILQILSTYGVRGCQVRRLRLEDVRWSEEEILFKAVKQGKDSLLPLTEEVGHSLLDYLRTSRPKSPDQHVFLTCSPPYRPLRRTSNISLIVADAMRAANLDCKRAGAHAFRHGFATRMLKQGHSLKEIADVIGHRSLESTFIYTKVDYKTLEQVGLEWPEEVRS